MYLKIPHCKFLLEFFFFLTRCFIYFKVKLLTIYKFRIVCPLLKIFYYIHLFIWGVTGHTCVCGHMCHSSCVEVKGQFFGSWFSPSVMLVRLSGMVASVITQ